jgi:hypothetical protein
MNKLKTLYLSALPFISIYSTYIGISTGMSINRELSYKKPFDEYSNIIGYTSLGMITGLTYPISYPAFGCYVLYKTKFLEKT